MDRPITYAVVLAIFLQIVLLIAVPKSALGEMSVVLMALPLVTIVVVVVFAVFLGGRKKRVPVKAEKPQKRIAPEPLERKGEGEGGKREGKTGKKGFFARLGGLFSGGNGVVKKLDSQKKVILEELKQTENQFLKHQIDRDTFDTMSNEKNTQLVRVEAEIDSVKNSELGGEELKKLREVSAKKRRVLEELLKQRQKKIVELKIAERAYLKRKISEASFKKISSEIKSELISVNSKISLVQTEDEISKIKQNLKEGLQEIGVQKKISKERKIDELEDDIFEQIERNTAAMKRR